MALHAHHRAGPRRRQGQHIVSTISSDQGHTWSKPIDIEPSNGPEASWVVPLVVPSGRVYAFYTYNGDHVETLHGKPIRADTLGDYAWKYSDDNGRSWSSQRYRLPMRVTACDRANDWSGKVLLFWGICKPVVADHSAYFSFTKLARHMLDDGEGWLFRSDNILTESDPAKLHWQMLPDGDQGIRVDRFGSVQEEHNLVPLDHDALYCVYRTTNGYPCHTYSRDGGHTWQTPEPMTYTPGGRMIKTPRACPRVWRASNGKYLFWFHNHSGKSFKGRNPVWIAGGILRDGKLWWSQPEILLFDSNPAIGMSYPDLIQQDGRYWFTETQKTIAQVNPVDATLLEGLWNQGQDKTVAGRGLVAEVKPDDSTKEVPLPKSLDLGASPGFSLDLWLRLPDLSSGQVLLDGRAPTGSGIALTTTDHGTVRLDLSDGRNTASWDCDPGLLKPGKLHHVVAIVDTAPRILSFIVDGQLCDGGTHRQYGWTRFPSNLRDVRGSGTLRLASSSTGRIEHIRVYDRYLRTSEAIANFHAGPH